MTSTCTAGASPAPQGGTVIDGIYFLESATWYGGCESPSMAQSTWLVCGGLWNNADATPGGDGGLSRTNYLSAMQGTDNTLNPICTTQGTLPGMMYGYSAFADQLTLMSQYGALVLVTTYARQ